MREYVPSLKKSGKNWIGLCPFHNDRNPSFSVSEDYGIYKCFSCGEAGDVISFVEKMEKLSFHDAIRLLAGKAGVVISESRADNEKYQQRLDFISFNERLTKLFQFFLKEKPDGKAALIYLKNRGITPQLIDTFKIGYVPAGYGRLEKILLKKGFKTSFLIQSGLFREDNGKLKTLFFDRVIFPIYNYKNECVGFGGRTLRENQKPKYINSPETLVYKKSFQLYGINVAKQKIQQTGEVFIVEGYFDVVTCYQNGLTNCVAPCGTAVTKEQIKILSRYAPKITLLLDGDEAGCKGAVKAIFEAANIENIQLKVLLLPEQMDPDDFFQQSDLNYFEKFKSQAVNALDFFLFQLTKGINIEDYSELITALNKIFEYIRLWDNTIIQQKLLDETANFFNIDQKSVREEYKKNHSAQNFNQEVTDNSKQQNQKVPLTLSIKKEVDLILLLLSYENSVEIIKKSCLNSDHFANEEIQSIFTKIVNQEIKKSTNLLDHFHQSDLTEYVKSRIFSDEFNWDEKNLVNNIIDRIYDLLKNYYLRQNQDIQEKIKLGKMYQNYTLIKDLQEEKILLLKEIQKLEKLQELKR
ncbi:MAG: DNA primase [Spirochaetes bacterium]|nr:DNA primase [Spirochaetota bacterium]